MTFTVENFMSTITNMIKSGSFDLRFSAGDNSHFGQWVLALLTLMYIPFYIKLICFLAKKFKLFRNLWFLGFVGMIICYICEFVVGYFFNINPFQLNLWDYSYMVINGIPFHLLGQINLFYAPVWFIVGLFIFPIFQSFFKYDDDFLSFTFETFIKYFQVLFTKAGNIPQDSIEEFIKVDSEFFKGKRI
jgi:hypothetical protein